MIETNNKSISVFFPCYNDESSIKIMVENAVSILKKLTKDWEIIVVDDKSDDQSREVLKKLAKKQPKLKLIFHETNKGYGCALQSGFRAASKELVFYTDGDGQYDVKELPILLSLMADDVDFVNGIKLARHDPTYRIFIGNVYSFAARWLFWLPINDVDCDFRLIRRSLLKNIKMDCRSGSICIELVKKAQRINARFCQVSIHHFERPFGQSQFFQIRHLFPTFLELGSLWIKLMILRK